MFPACGAWVGGVAHQADAWRCSASVSRETLAAFSRCQCVCEFGALSAPAGSEDKKENSELSDEADFEREQTNHTRHGRVVRNV